MNAGDTFQLVGVADKHLWVILSDPQRNPDRVLIVNFTTFDRFADQTVVLNAGEGRRFIVHKTCVNYPRARILSLASLVALRRGDRLKCHDPVTPLLLQKLRAGAGLSPRLAAGCYQLLEEQGLLED